MKWLKTIKARWLILIIVLIQFIIWIPPYLISGGVELVIEVPEETVEEAKPKAAEEPDPEFSFKDAPALLKNKSPEGNAPILGELSKKSGRKRKKPRSIFGGQQVDRSLSQIQYERSYLQHLIDDGDAAMDEITALIQNRISFLEREERTFLRKRIREKKERNAAELEELTLLAYGDDSKPKLKTNQPTLLIYADWFLINWQALLSIFTILPIVFVRWKNLLSGKPIAANTPEVK